jgi:hypothetical protein
MTCEPGTEQHLINKLTKMRETNKMLPKKKINELMSAYILMIYRYPIDSIFLNNLHNNVNHPDQIHIEGQSSCGYKYKLNGYKNKKECHPIALNDVKDQIQEGTMWQKQRYSLVYSKAEVKPKYEKPDRVLSRPIICGDADLSICNLMFLQPFNDLMARRRWATENSIGISNFSDDHMRLANQMRADDKNREFLSYDVQAWDLHCPSYFALMCAYFRDQNYYKDHLTEKLRNIHLENCYRDIYTELHLPGGKTYVKLNGVTTGFEATCPQNCFIHTMAMYTSLFSSKQDVTELRAKVLGDDNKLSYIKGQFNVKKYYKQMSELGFTCADEVKGKYDEVSFLQITPKFINGHWRPTRDKNLLIAKLYFCDHIGSSFKNANT